MKTSGVTRGKGTGRRAGRFGEIRNGVGMTGPAGECRSELGSRWGKSFVEKRKCPRPRNGSTVERFHSAIIDFKYYFRKEDIQSRI